MIPALYASNASPMCLNCSLIVRTGLGVLKSPGMLAVPGEKSNLSCGTVSAAPMISRSMPLSWPFSVEAMVGAAVEACVELELDPLDCAKLSAHDKQKILATTAMFLSLTVASPGMKLEPESIPPGTNGQGLRRLRTAIRADFSHAANMRRCQSQRGRKRRSPRARNSCSRSECRESLPMPAVPEWDRATYEMDARAPADSGER